MKLRPFALFSLILLISTSCKKDSSEGLKSHLVGKWYMYKMESADYSYSTNSEEIHFSNPIKDYYMNFQKNGTIETSSNSQYKFEVISENKFEINADGVITHCTVRSISKNELIYDVFDEYTGYRSRHSFYFNKD